MHISRPAAATLISPSRGWVLYDDSCGFCRRWVPFWATTLRRRGYDIAPLQSKWVSEHFKLPHDELIHDLRLLLVDGTRVQGADVYRHLMRQIWWAYPLYLLACTPVLRRIFDLCYRSFATNRFRFSRACGLRHDSHSHPHADFHISNG
jgi:predicted DCC family thiol-disulfide oxidoreductase YuxK